MAITNSINLSSLDGNNGFRLDGVSEYDSSGNSVSNAGDVNGDGFDDVIIGARGADPNGDGSGSSYVVFGRVSGFDAAMDLSSLNGNNGFRLDGAAGDFTGRSLSNAGDVNDDGFDDLIVGAPGANSSYVVFGKSSGFDASLNLSALDGSNGVRLDGGSSVSSVGDINGDGFDDVIVGSRGFNGDYSVPVTVDYVVFGKASGFSPTLNLSDLNGSDGFRLDINTYIAATQSVSSAGDMNGDGYDDLIIGILFPSAYRNAINGTASYVVFGKASGFDAAVNLSSLDGSNGFRLTGAGFGLYGGALNVDDAGDINGDGFDDVIIGAPENSQGGYYAGSSYVVFGKASGFDASINLSNLDGNNGFRVDGAEASNSLGSSVSSAGDVNGDGFDDVIIGVRLFSSSGYSSDSSYVVFGKASGFDTVMDISSLDSNSGVRLDGGSSVSSAGDINGDGLDDLLVGASNAAPNGDRSGSSYVIFGSRQFEGTVTYVGTDGDDNFTGTPADERFEVGDGNDTMTGGGGADVFEGGDGDDTIRVPDLAFQTLDGGGGIDTLELAGGGIDLNLANFHNTINGIEAIDLTGSDDNTLTLTLTDLFDISNDRTLKVNGDAGDRVVIRGGGWLDGGIDGDFHTYTNRDNVVLQIDVAVDTNPPTLGGVFSLSSLNGSNGFRLDGVAEDDRSGRSVSNAGDVNGDGFGDVIIGAPNASPNGDHSGSSYVVFGRASGFSAAMDLSSLNGSNGFRLDGVAAFDGSGKSVSNAGDINDDGFADVIVGAFGADSNGRDSGSSYVIFGRATGFEATLDLSNLNGNNGFRLDGTAEGDFSGASVSSAGDVNSDGFDDVIIGAPLADDPNGNNSGSSYVVFGQATGFNAAIDLSNLNGSNGFRLNGSVESVSSVGDVNGDGFDDVIVGSVGNTYQLSFSYVVFGKATGFDAAMDLSDLDGGNGFRLDGEATGDQSGYSVSNAGDVNSDGFDDMLVGAPGSGSSYVIFGQASGFSATLDLSSLDGTNGFRMDGTVDDGLGGSVSSAGDVNGDGFSDLLISTNRGDLNSPSYVVFGKASGFDATLDLSTLDGNNGLRVDGIADSNSTDISVSGAGDVNGDGFDDLLIGQSYAHPNGDRSGSSYVIFGSRDFGRAAPDIVGTPGDDNLTGTPLAERFEAGAGNDRMTGFGGADIFRGDSGDDVIRVPDLDFQIVDGGMGNDTLELMGGGINPSLANFRGRINGIETIDLTGSGDNTLPDLLSLSDTTDIFTVNGNLGDRVYGLINGWEDGGIDGDYHVYRNQEAVLRVDTAVSTDWLKPGINLADLNGNNGFRLDGETVVDESGHSVSNAGDVNGDGFDDVIVGAPGADLGGNDAGSSYVVFGRVSGFAAALNLASLDGNNGFRLNGAYSGGSGFSVSDAGDVNDDGYADVIIGTSGTGSSYVVFGKASGFNARLNLSSLDGNNGFRMKGGAASDRSGASVSSAGDVNGDGFDDVIVGASGRDSNGYSVSSYVVFGRASGFEAAIDLGSLDGSNGFRLDGVVTEFYARASVSNAGDVNGDGFADVMVGVAGVDSNGTRSGSSYVVFGRASGFDATMDLSSLDGSNGFRLDGETTYDFSGSSVSSAGDVNGDGFDDLIVGASNSGSLNSGSSYVVFGKASGFDATLNLSSLDGNNGFRLNGVTAYDGSGFSVSGAGDVNGDGLDDLLVGAYNADLNGSSSGSSYVVFGRASGFDAAMDLSSLDGNNGIRLDGVTAFDSSAYSVSGAGDVNGDGFDDLIVGAPGADPNGIYSGSSYVIFGRSDFGGGGGNVIAGTPGDDVLKGTSGADIFEAGDGNDLMVGRGGADVFRAGAGNDKITVTDLDFASVAGGAGNDVLHLAGNGLNLDLADFGANISGIETFCLFGQGDNTLTLTAADLLNLSDTSDTLKVNGNAAGHIIVEDSGWIDEGLRGSGYYHVYTNEDAVLLVGQNITIDFAVV